MNLEGGWKDGDQVAEKPTRPKWGGLVPVGSGIGCLLLIALAILLAPVWEALAFVVVFNNTEHGPGPLEPIERSITSSVMLDTGHPFAFQPFSIGYCEDSSLDAAVDAGQHTVRLVLFPQFISPPPHPPIPMATIEGTRLHVDHMVTGDPYLIGVELVPKSSEEAVKATLTITIHGEMSFFAGEAKESYRFLNAEPLSVRPTSVVTASFHQSLSSGGLNQLRLRLTMAGEARLVHEGGGSGYLVLTVRVEGSPQDSSSSVIDGSAGYVYPQLDPIVTYHWPSALDGVALGYLSCYYCSTIDLSFATLWAVFGNATGDASLVVEARSYMLDRPAVPDGASLTLTALPPADASASP